MQLENAIKERKSVRRFLDKKPDWRKIIRAIDLARFAPAAGNMFTTKFILVKDPERIKKLADASQQDFVKSAHYVVAVVSDDEKLKKSYNERGERYARQQAGAAIQNFLLALVDQGLVTCWVGHFDDELVRNDLGVPEDVFVEAFFPIGKETKALAQSGEKAKPDLETVIYFDKWKNKLMEPETRVTHEGS